MEIRHFSEIEKEPYLRSFCKTQMDTDFHRLKTASVSICENLCSMQSANIGEEFISPGHENFGLLKLTPWRIALVTFPAPSHEDGQRIWHSREES